MRADALEATVSARTSAASGARFGLIRMASDETAPDAIADRVDPRLASTNAVIQHAAQGTSLIG